MVGFGSMNESAREWIGMSDLMAGLMLVFLFLAVLFLVRSEEESAESMRHKEELEAITDGFAVDYSNYRERLHRDLREEFEQDLLAWNAEILSDNTIRFRGPEVLFGKGRDDITSKFKGILSDFFPRYVRVLSRAKHKDNINEIRILGHTSSEWESAGSFEDRYLKNMELSQTRAFSVLRYCMGLNRLDSVEKEWLGGTLRANGLAFAQPVRVEDKEHPAQSRRVEFKVLTKTEENVERLLKKLETLKK